MNINIQTVANLQYKNQDLSNFVGTSKNSSSFRNNHIQKSYYAHNTNFPYNNTVDIFSCSVIFTDRAGYFLPWGVKTSITDGKRQSLIWCYPRSTFFSFDRGDGCYVQGFCLKAS